MTAIRTVLVTNASGYAGPGAVGALLEAGFRVLAHDASFGDPASWRAFAGERENLEPLSETEPEAVVSAAFERADRLDAIVSNDHHPAPSRPPGSAPIEALRDNQYKLVEFPFRLIRAALPSLRAQGGANVVMITSNRDRLPLQGGAFPDATRAAANALVRSLAVDLAPDRITVNAVAPNFLYSEQFYPAAFYKRSEAGRDYVRRSVATGQLAEPEEIGELIVFLASAKTRFLTGAVIDFSGGWPFGPPRPTG
ncbi:SDR family oxidoreductase [Marinicauda algicola]|uniref:SDR family oxidoreductase n=1 Tax=Marinicauda algicola TaxID=2029849 RepID=A0A4S2GXP1_9PROT|nr:SDR family oxidoreductase [Marinicauda algicola]TGY87542.1 SDR family oxidoreductase [Marinicauda algicola]